MRAATYLRSSKDRADASIAAQRSALVELAKARQLRVVAEFADAVESGKDEDRDGFQQLLAAVRNPRRGWDTLLVLDTARISRRRLHAVIFEEQTCRQAGIRIIYKSLPEGDPVTEMLLKSVLQAMDEWHSMTSRAKGLAGMRENVKAGWRAGGRAPMGYRLEHVDTGAMREGQAVRKSRLVRGPDAGAVAAYLVARSQGTPRARAGLPEMASPSKVGLEWNALTYAGHTVWNVHAEAGTGRKRRPRSEWMIQRATHEALIPDAIAEQLLQRLEDYAPTRARQRDAGYLLTGLLQTPDGRPYHGDRGAYRVRGHQIQAQLVDRAVAEHVLQDLQSTAFVKSVTAAARAMRPKKVDRTLQDALSAVDLRLHRLVGLIEETSAPGPLLRQMEALELERAALARAVADEAQDRAAREATSQISEMEVRRRLVERAATIEDADVATMREALAGLLGRVVIDGPDLQLHYRFDRVKVASPRAAEPIPVVRFHRLSRG